MKSISIADAWTDFAAHTIPLDASPVQRDDMRLAFYAGACIVLQFTLALAEIPDTATGVVILDRLHGERRAFTREMEERNRRHP